MTSVMSDRAAVMKNFDQKLHEYKILKPGDDDADIHFLSCNAHFLLGLSRACDSLLLCH